jgi:hypothetical protein
MLDCSFKKLQSPFLWLLDEEKGMTGLHCCSHHNPDIVRADVISDRTPCHVRVLHSGNPKCTLSDSLPKATFPANHKRDTLPSWSGHLLSRKSPIDPWLDP